MQTQIVLTINADDQTGLVEKVANAITAAGGNWLESSLSQLAGKFAGIVLVSITSSSVSQLEQSLASLTDCDIHVRIHHDPSDPTEENNELILVKVVANDRKGIVQELTKLLSSLHVNVESLDTSHISAPMSSDPLFEATALG